MALETGTYISDLVPTNPLDSDALAFADDHIRLIKQTLKNTFPNITGPQTLSQTQVKTAFDYRVPQGGIIMWSGAIASIPATWFLCDGTNGTPDLRDRFVIGARSDSLGVPMTNIAGVLTLLGGAKDLIVPAHSHTASSAFAGSALPGHNHGVNDPGHQHAIDTAVGGGYIGIINLNGGGAQTQQSQTGYTGISIGFASAGTPAGSVTTSVASTGSSATNANLPPYYALAFIMKG
jgi:hypothetical protein